jgi:hypothetical protein
VFYSVWLDVWRKFLSMLDEKTALDWQKAFIDGGFAPAKKEQRALQLQAFFCGYMTTNTGPQMFGSGLPSGRRSVEA